MLDINLLNKRGVYKPGNTDFDQIDEKIDCVVEVPSTINSNASKNDFESNYDNKKNKNTKKVLNSNRSSSKKSMLGLIVLFVTVFFSYYYYINMNTVSVSSKKISELIFHLLDDQDLQINQIKIDDKINVRLAFNSDSFNQNKAKLGSYFKKISNQDIFEYTLSDEELSIQSIDNIRIQNLNFDESVVEEDFSTNQISDIDKQELLMVIDSIFKINNKELINFDITQSNYLKQSTYYNILFYK